MVAPHPELNRRLRNTDSIVKANKSGQVPALQSRYPYDYIDIDTHRTIERVRPWREIHSPIGMQRIQLSQSMRLSQSSQSSKSLQPFTTDKILVLCVDFDDKPAQLSTETVYSRFFEDYTNSLKEYYKEVSHSRYIPDGEVHGWYRAPNPSTYYTNKENGFGKYPNSAEKLIEHVVDIASKDTDIDWTLFDGNDNGYIDNLIVIHSGAQASWTGDVNDFWAHVYIIPEPKVINGRSVWVYALVSEYLDTPDNYRLVGIDAHEHAHQIGLPDLYDYTNESSGVGYYSLMGSGSWSLKGMWPAHLDAWSKYVLGFADAKIDPVGYQYLTNIETDPNILKYTTSDPKQYFLVENRQKISYDKYLPSEGMLIWRINENQIDNQMYNDDKSCYLVGLVQADNFNDLENKANNGDLGDPYPGITDNRSFGVDTNPNSILCNKNIQRLLINGISDSAKTMIFESNSTI